MLIDTICHSAACSRLQRVEVHAVGLWRPRNIATMPSCRTRFTHSAGHSLPQAPVPAISLTSAGHLRRPHAPRKLHFHPSGIMSNGLRLRARKKIPVELPTPKTEAWYNHHLTKSIRRSSRPPLRYDSPNAVLSESKLRSALRANPLKLFESKPPEHADLHEAGKCLELYIARHSPTQGETLAQTREHYVQDRPGSRGLAWSCSLSDAERKTLWGDLSFTAPVTHCLVAEGAIASLWDWLKLDMSIGPNDPFGNGVLRWKQDVLRSMVEAQMFWSENTDYWTDAIKSLME